MNANIDASKPPVTPTPSAAQPAADETNGGKAKTRGKKSGLLLLQLILTLVAFGYLFHISDLAALGRAFHEAPLWTIPSATLTLLGVMFAGTLRWRLLLNAYGAIRTPSIGYLFRLQLIGLFYNMMPGAVGGDVLRGVVSRHAFGPQGMSAGLAVVLVERIFGLIALMLLVVGVLSVHPIRMLHLSPWVFAVGLSASIGSVAAIALGRRLAPRLPPFLATRAAALPALTNVTTFAIALGMSVINQAMVGLMGHWTITALAPQVSVLDSLVLSPLAFAAIFFPLTVAGAGTRDAAMVALYGLVDVPKEGALSASLEILLAYGLVAALGGALSLITPLRSSDE